MPIYEYRCGACGTEFERYVPSPATAATCPSCASDEVRRKLSIFGLKTDGGVLPSTMGSGGACCGGGCSCH